MIEHRHFFIVDSDGNRVGKFDIQSEKGRQVFRENHLPDDLAIEPIRIPDHAEGRGQALDMLVNQTVDWDNRLIDE